MSRANSGDVYSSKMGSEVGGRHLIEDSEEMTKLNSILYKLGSPYNLLSRLTSSGSLEDQSVKHDHYTESQQDFAHLSMSSLIYLINSFNLKDILGIRNLNIDDIETLTVSESELVELELFYKAISDARLAIARKTTDVNAEAEGRYSYRASDHMSQTITPLGQADGKYSNYRAISYQGVSLSLKGCIEILDVTPQPIDRQINLGMFLMGNHLMGNYRQESSDKENKVLRVDYITALAMKKSLLAHHLGDKENALKYALVFGVLRGYNIRSDIGACWAQEISMNCLMSALDLEPFRKAAKVYLDIAACCEPMFGGSGELSNLIRREMYEYLNPNITNTIFAPSEALTEEIYAEFLETISRYEISVESVMQSSSEDRMLGSGSSSGAGRC